MKKKDIYLAKIIMKKILLLLLVCTFFVKKAALAQAQTLSYGFKTGLSLSKIDGTSEIANGTELESPKNTTGFLVGAIFRYWFTDLMGIKWELLYAQKGTKYNFDGQGFQSFPTDVGERINLTGNQRIDLNISNSYIDIPILLYGKFGQFEIEGGVNVGFLVAATATGELNFNSTSLTDPLSMGLDYKYFKDKPGEVNFDEGILPILFNGKENNLPKVLKTYYQFPEDRGKYFNTIDLGLNAGLYYYWNQGLFLGARFNYGLSDVTNKDYDVSRVSLDSNGNFIPRSDKDRNISWQFSLGFSF